MQLTKILKPDLRTRLYRPIFLDAVPAGFPSPAADFMEGKLDLNEHLIQHPASTFFVRVTGDSMLNAGIHSGDLLIVDRSLIAENGRIIIAIVDGELTVKRFENRHGAILLHPENHAYQTITIHEYSDFAVWGVVTSVIHSV